MRGYPTTQDGDFTLLKLASLLFYLTVLVPISFLRALRGSSPFGRRAFLAPSAWDAPRRLLGAWPPRASRGRV